jgi:hypothetical protein
MLTVRGALQDIPKLYIPIKREDLPKVKRERDIKFKVDGLFMLFRKYLQELKMNLKKQRKLEKELSQDQRTFRPWDGQGQVKSNLYFL